MKAIIYRVELLEPVLVSDLEGDPNSAVAFNYLPGSVLRGVFIGRYLSANANGDLAQDEMARRLFFNGQTRYLNGYPLDRLGLERRALPTPRSWQQKKDGEKKVYDFAREAPHDAFDDGVQWESASQPFCVVERDLVRLIKPERRIAVHTARTRRFGRAMPEQAIDKREDDQPGAVYRYDALAAGQTFEAVILCEDYDEAALRQLIEGEIKLGKSRSGGYGRARLQSVKQAPQAKPWTEYQRQTLDPAEDEEDEGDEPDDVRLVQFVVTLLSDVLLRDDCGQHVVDAQAMIALLHRELAADLKSRRAFLSERIIGGFNRKWGMPLPQAAAFAMGSVFVYEADGALDRQRVNALLERGIGERRAEGFGRLAINWQAEDTLTIDDTEATPPRARLEPLTKSAEATAQLMVERLLRQKLDRKVVEQANRVGQGRGKPGVMDKPPRNSQLARLRAVLHEALRETPPDLERIRSYLQDIGERAAARRQFEQARIAQHNLRSWLEAVLQQSNEAAWRKLFDIKDVDLRGVGGIKPRLSEQLRHEYLLRFIDAVLARAAKQVREEEQT